MFFTITFDILVLAYFLSRQVRVRPVPRIPRLQMAAVLSVIGLIELVDYSSHHHVTHTDYAWFFGTLVVGAMALGALRAWTVKVWVANNWVVRQGTWVTMALWLVSIALHFASTLGSDHAGAGNLEASSFLLYIGVTYAVQNYVVHRRAMPLWESLGPTAGQRIQVNFGQGPGGAGAFFTTFRSGGQGYPPPSPPERYDDPNIIDAEVVDDDGPAELH
jgi:hypothetical protein